MNGYLQRDRTGAWFFCTQAFGHVFDFPFEHGPSGSDAPATRTLLPGEGAHLTPQGTVLVDRGAAAWSYAGRIDPRSAAVGIPEDPSANVRDRSPGRPVNFEE